MFRLEQNDFHKGRDEASTRKLGRVALAQLKNATVTGHYSSRQGQRLQRLFCRYDGELDLIRRIFVNAQQSVTTPEDVENAIRFLAP